jgi:hypothetical protein
MATEAWGKPRDSQRLPGPLGNGYWSQELYYHILNAGIRLPPSAGSASGVLPNPVGYNRVDAASADLSSDNSQQQTAQPGPGPVPQLASHLTAIVQQLEPQPETASAIRAIAASRTRGGLDDAVKPLTLFSVSVNPESRVKIASTRDRLTVQTGVSRRFLVKCENSAGTTAPLRIRAIDVSTQPPQPASWCEVKIIDNKVVARDFTSAAVEYKIVELTPGEPGLHELRFVADAGQGTQDLGFRASTDLLIDVENTPHSLEGNP